MPRYTTPQSKKKQKLDSRVSDTAIATGMKVDTCQRPQNRMNVCHQSMQNMWIKFTQLSCLVWADFSLSATFSFPFYSADGGEGDRVTQPGEDAAAVF